MILLKVVHNIVQPFHHINTCQLINVNIIRPYRKWFSRTPTAIVNEHEIRYPDKQKPVKTLRRKKQKTIKSSEKPKITPETETKYVFTKLKENEKIVSAMLTNLRSRKRRDKKSEVVLEGFRLIEDALKYGLIPKAIIFNNFSDINALKLPEKVMLYKCTYRVIQTWSTLATSPGLLGIFSTPDISKNPSDDNAIPLTIICDNVREPGNLGSIIRVAAGVGCEKLILLKGCVDVWEPKVVRTAAGCHFRLPIYSHLLWDEIPSKINEDSNIIITDSNFDDEHKANYSPDMLESNTKVFDVDPDILKKKLAVDENTNTTDLIIPNNKNIMQQFLSNLPIVPYHTLDYTKKETVIILSGETEGLSTDAYNFLNETKGIRINIPLLQGVDSLNVGVALGIILFEIRRQFIKKQSEL